jgi:hypothetical protein
LYTKNIVNSNFVGLTLKVIKTEMFLYLFMTPNIGGQLPCLVYFPVGAEDCYAAFQWVCNN